MAEIHRCPECKVPRHISDEHEWLDSGVIISKRDRRHRMTFIESENLDPVYEGIARIIGVPIERIVIDASRRRTREYMSQLLPDNIVDLVRNRQIVPQSLIYILRDTALLMGYGKFSLEGLQYEDDEQDHVTVHIQEPFSVPLVCGSYAGSVEVLSGWEPGISYREVSPGVIEVTVIPAKNPPELKGRLGFKGYHQEYKAGDIELERCGTCGVPKALSGFKWHFDSGTIISSWTHRRMALLGAAMLDPVFDELEEELGETIPQVVVEAQRHFVKTGFYSIEEVGDGGNIRNQFALRGLGNLKEIRMGRKGVTLRIENAAVHLLVVGLAQGLFEMAFGIDSNVDWELSEQGDLEIEVIPTGTEKTVTI
jgi:hypothetical protein